MKLEQIGTAYKVFKVTGEMRLASWGWTSYRSKDDPYVAFYEPGKVIDMSGHPALGFSTIAEARMFMSSFGVHRESAINRFGYSVWEILVYSGMQRVVLLMDNIKIKNPLLSDFWSSTIWKDYWARNEGVDTFNAPYGTVRMDKFVLDRELAPSDMFGHSLQGQRLRRMLRDMDKELFYERSV